MTQKQRDALKKKVMRLVQNDSASTVIEIASKLVWKKPYYSQQSIRSAVWALIDAGTLELNMERRLVLKKK